MRRVLVLLVLFAVGAVVVPPVIAPYVGWRRDDALPPAGETLALSSGHAVNVLDRGDGEPLVLVHGLPGSGYHWQPLSQALASAGLRAISYDRVGYGYSSRRVPSEPHDFETNALDLIGLLDALELDSATVVGWSYGGGVALEAARVAPGRIDALVLVASTGPAHGVEPVSDPVARLLFRPRVMRWTLDAGFPSHWWADAILAEFFGDTPVPPGFRDRGLALLRHAHGYRTWLRESEQYRPAALKPEPVAARALVVHGTDDRVMPLPVGEDLARRLPNGELQLVFGGDHMLPVSSTKELAGYIVAFLAGPPTPDSGEASPAEN